MVNTYRAQVADPCFLDRSATYIFAFASKDTQAFLNRGFVHAFWNVVILKCSPAKT
jgi:hypothetical protein